MVTQLLEGIPWALPVIVAVLLIATLARNVVAGWLRTTALNAFLLLASVGGILAVTLTPVGHQTTARPVCRLDTPGLIGIQEILPVTERSLNVLLFVPFGVAVGLLPASKAKAGWLVVAIAAPASIELTQYMAIGLGRECETVDIVDNLAGLGAGLLLASVTTLIRPTRQG